MVFSILILFFVVVSFDLSFLVVEFVVVVFDFGDFGLILVVAFVVDFRFVVHVLVVVVFDDFRFVVHVFAVVDGGFRLLHEEVQRTLQILCDLVLLRRPRIFSVSKEYVLWWCYVKAKKLDHVISCKPGCFSSGPLRLVALQHCPKFFAKSQDI